MAQSFDWSVSMFFNILTACFMSSGGILTDACIQVVPKDSAQAITNMLSFDILIHLKSVFILGSYYN